MTLVTKAPLVLNAQIALLAERGLPVAKDEQLRTARMLLDHNYYRLSGYWRYFQKAPHLGDNTFQPSANVDTIKKVYEYDAILRSVLFEGLAEFEIAFRSRLAYFLATDQGACTYLDQAAYRPTHLKRPDGTKVDLVRELLLDINKDLDRSREDYIKHHVSRGQRIPIWVAVEVLSFGTVSKLYRLLDDQDVKYKISKTFELPKPELLESVARSFTVLRNVCAHHGRVWNRRPEVPLKVLKDLQTESDHDIYNQTPWGWIVMLAHLVDKIRKDDQFSVMLMNHVDSSPEFIDGLKKPHRR